MRFGVVLPQNEGMREPKAVRDFALAAEDLGYHHLIAFDHVLGADPEGRPPGWRTSFNHKSFIHEPLILFGFLAGVTTTLEFSSEIVILPQRQTVLFAKQAAQADYLSGGRLRLGIGIGWNELEYESLNEDFRNRGARVTEQVEVLRELWTKEVVDFKGKWHQIDRAGVNPMPIQRPIPIWMGGSADAVLRRTARVADGWMPLFNPHEQTSTELINRLQGYLKEAGRRPEEFGIEGRINLPGKTPEDWHRDLEAWVGLGATHIGVATGGSSDLEEHLDLLTGFRSEVASTLR